jgi:hypothetical protein
VRSIAEEPLAALSSLNLDYCFLAIGAFAAPHGALAASGHNPPRLVDIRHEVLRAARLAWHRSDGQRRCLQLRRDDRSQDKSTRKTDKQRDEHTIIALPWGMALNFNN